MVGTSPFARAGCRWSVAEGPEMCSAEQLLSAWRILGRSDPTSGRASIVPGPLVWSVCAVLACWLAMTSLVRAAACPGDCNGDGTVTIGELVTGVGIVLGQTPLSACEAFDTDHDHRVIIAELITAVNAALNGCPQTPTPTQSPVVGFSIDGCVNEFPGEGCGQPGVTVRLDPLGLTADTNSTPDFHFGNIPPGHYTLSVVQQCNRYGCWETVPVTITNDSVFVDIDLVPNQTPTPQPTS